MVDAAWADRQRAGIEPVIEAVALARGVAPEDPGVLWRVVRLEIARGLMEPHREDRLRRFAGARESGWRCITRDPQVMASRHGDDWTGAVGALTAERTPCAGWTALAWMRWAEDFGLVAAAIDAPVVRALLAVRPGPEAELPNQWAQALAERWEDPRGGRAILQALANRPDDPTGGVARVDLYALIDRGTEREEKARSLLEANPPRSPEGRAYMERVLGR